MKYKEKFLIKLMSKKVKTKSPASQDANALNFWKGVGQNINDNASVRIASRQSVVAWAAFGIFLVSMVSLNMTALATQAALHVDGRVFGLAMDVSPNSVAYVFNKTNVGE